MTKKISPPPPAPAHRCPSSAPRALMERRPDGRFDLFLPDLTLEEVESLASGLLDRAFCYRRLWEGTGGLSEALHIELAERCEMQSSVIMDQIDACRRALSDEEVPR